MSNHYQIKARAILSHASVESGKLQAKAAELLEKGEIDPRDMMFMEQTAIQNQILAALSYTMMGLPSPVNISEINVENPVQGTDPETDTPPPTEEPLPEPEHESPFNTILGDPLDVLEAVVTVGRMFTGQRPVKDSPQA